MTEREVKQLIKLLRKFRLMQKADNAESGRWEDYHSGPERSILYATEQAVKWYGINELSMDI